MKCPYCAEEIKDDAIFCRFCSATKENGNWVHPANVSSQKSSKNRGIKLTTRTASAFFIISGIAESISIGASVQLFGTVYSGFIASVYHLLFIGVYFGMGIGLWVAKPWSYRMMWIGTSIYSLDKIMSLFANQETSTLLAEYGPMLGTGAENTIVLIMQAAVFVSLASWWGFLGYIIYHRKYFLEPEHH